MSHQWMLLSGPTGSFVSSEKGPVTTSFSALQWRKGSSVPGNFLSVAPLPTVFISRHAEHSCLFLGDRFSCLFFLAYGEGDRDGGGEGKIDTKGRKEVKNRERGKLPPIKRKWLFIFQHFGVAAESGICCSL